MPSRAGRMIRRARFSDSKHARDRMLVGAMHRRYHGYLSPLQGNGRILDMASRRKRLLAGLLMDTGYSSVARVLVFAAG
jgi:hypothetical protein